VQDAVEKLSEFVETVSNRGLQISVDQDLSQVVLKVVNKDNEETIRQIPTEEVLELMKRMKDLSEEFFGDATGLLVENKV
jgi:flagellar protein FlaG